MTAKVPMPSQTSPLGNTIDAPTTDSGMPHEGTDQLVLDDQPSGITESLPAPVSFKSIATTKPLQPAQTLQPQCPAQTTWEFLIDGHADYEMDSGIIKEPPQNQLGGLLTDFLNERCISPSLRAKTKFALTEIQDILTIRARKAGYTSLTIEQKHLCDLLAQRQFKLVNYHRKKYVKCIVSSS